MTYSPEAVELYNFTVNEAKLHSRRQHATSYARNDMLVRLCAIDTVTIVVEASRAYPGDECFTCEHILEAALMLHREDMKAVEEDKRNGGKGEL